MSSPAQLTKDFVKAFQAMCQHRHRYEVFSDFLELASTAIRVQKTLPPGDEAEKPEQRYMDVVKRYDPDDIRKVPELLGITALAVQEGGCDFLGRACMELELGNEQIGQYFTPYETSRLMAEMTLADAGELIKQKGWITLCEPACGSGGMVLAAADVIAAQGHDIGKTLYVDVIDLFQDDLCPALTSWRARDGPPRQQPFARDVRTCTDPGVSPLSDREWRPVSGAASRTGRADTGGRTGRSGASWRSRITAYIGGTGS